VEALPIRVEVDIAGGMPGFATVGLAEGAVKEARVRAQTAIANSGLPFPIGRITVNLAPAHCRKEGTALDFPMALGLLAADGLIPKPEVGDVLAYGELSLSGRVRPVRGVLAAAEAARKAGARRILVATENGAEANLVEGLEVRTVDSFSDAVAFLKDGAADRAPRFKAATRPAPRQGGPDLRDVRGQLLARRALEIAAAGGHNLIFIGGPGSGKTMMARRLPSILPPLSHDEALEVTRIHSVAGVATDGTLILERPFRAPHHSTTPAGLVGGGSGIPRPGELSLAHNGVLFLDEIAEFPRPVLEVLRQPLETGEVILSRAQATLKFPARSMFMAAMNPCPCGHLGSPRRACHCPPHAIQRYRMRVSGPLLDRLDLQVEVPPVELAALQSKEPGEPSSAVRKRVLAARDRQARRQGEGVPNADLSPSAMREFARPDPEGERFLALAVERLGLSARSYDRVLRLARTIADLAGDPSLRGPHVAEAISLKSFEKKGAHA
jgi:magnesium chelatase family protein